MIEYDPRDWRGHLCDIAGSLVHQIAWRVLTCVLWTVGVVALEMWLHTRGLSLAIPDLGHSLIGVAFGLLLVFRTNSSYDRFWEARKQWGAIVNASRNLASAASVLLAKQPQQLRSLLHWCAVFPWTVMYRLQLQRGCGPVAEQLAADDVARVLAAEHPALAAAREMTATLDRARSGGTLSDFLFASLQYHVAALIDCLGACERIRHTPLPFAYMVHLRRALILYCFTLPFALVGRFGWATVPAVLVIAYVFYGIEEIGVEIEDPFGDDDNDLPLEKMCAAIQRNVLAFAPPETDAVN